MFCVCLLASCALLAQPAVDAFHVDIPSINRFVWSDSSDKLLGVNKGLRHVLANSQPFNLRLLVATLTADEKKRGDVFLKCYVVSSSTTKRDKINQNGAADFVDLLVYIF